MINQRKTDNFISQAYWRTFLQNMNEQKSPSSDQCTYSRFITQTIKTYIRKI